MSKICINKLKHTEFLNSIMWGDSLDIMSKMPDNSIDMLLVDLPYGITQNKWDSVIPLEGLWKEYNRIVKDNGAMIFTASGLFTAQLMLSNPKNYKYKIVWEKSKSTNFLNAKIQPLRKHEDIVVFYRKQPTYNPQMTKGKAYNKGIRKNQLTGSYGDFNPVLGKSNGDRYPVDVIYFKTAESEGKVIHPTQKPVGLARYLIRTYSNIGDVVLDNTCGSGTFLVAALREGRNFVGIEKNIDYAEFSKNRILKTYENMLIADGNILKEIVPINLLESQYAKQIKFNS